MTTRDDLDSIRRKIGQANPVWPKAFVDGYVDGMLDGLDGHGPELSASHSSPGAQSGYRAAYAYYSNRQAALVN